jgi:hypothetical protein
MPDQLADPELPLARAGGRAASLSVGTLPGHCINPTGPATSLAGCGAARRNGYKVRAMDSMLKHSMTSPCRISW